MPVNLPNLDDRTFADLMEEALALIPAHAPEWTNHNPSDPGITILELFAFLTEMLIYRLNRVTDTNKQTFLKLLNEPGWQFDETKSLEKNIQETIVKLREEQRAITVEDFERLARAADNRVARAYCLPRRKLERYDLLLMPVLSNIDEIVGEGSGITPLEANQPEAPGHISVVIVPHPSPPDRKPPFEPDEDLIRKVKDVVKPRCLITTRLHVAGPRYLKIAINITLKINPDALEQKVREKALDELAKYFHPLIGGAQNTGWPLGRNVYVSDIYALLDKLPGVDVVEKHPAAEKSLIALVPENLDRRLPSDEKKELVGVRLELNELVDFQREMSDINIIVKDTKYNRNRIKD